jgi:hypothetical protein
VKLQQDEETCRKSGNWKMRHRDEVAFPALLDFSDPAERA